MKNFKVIDFRFATPNDKYNLKFKQDGAWSRIYEYEYILDFINSNGICDISVHNSSWGFEGIHITFRDSIDSLSCIFDTIHSDIVKSEFRDTFHYDITKPFDEFKENFDFVLNVSTIEHLKNSKCRISSIVNLYDQVKPGGYLMLTFDYPRVNLDEIERLLNTKCDDSKTKLNGANSINPNTSYQHLNIVYLVIKKLK